MADCSNLRFNEETGSYEDSLSFEEVVPERLMRFSRGNHIFCYDLFSLLRLIAAHRQSQARTPLLIPATRDPFTAAELATITARADELFPFSYIVAQGDVVLPYPFFAREAAIAYVNERGSGSVFAARTFNDGALYETMYPHGIDDMEQVFGLRGQFQIPQWGEEEEAVRDEVYERAPFQPQERPRAQPLVQHPRFAEEDAEVARNQRYQQRRR